MNYELAKELELAGFKTKPGRGHVLMIKPGGGDSAHFPGLSELIEACGGDFKSLEHFDPSVTARPHWAAFTREQHWNAGETPEEAVARLWLALAKIQRESDTKE